MIGTYVAALVGLVASIALTFLGLLWVGPLGDVSTISLGSVCVLYALSQNRFKSVGYTDLESIVLAVLFANAFLQSYELMYNLTFALVSVYGDPPSATGTETRMVILWLVMISPLLLVRKHLCFKRTGAALFLLLVGVWVIWALYGYPQYYLPGYYVLPTVLKTSDAFHLSLMLNFGSKALLAALYASLLEPSRAIRSAVARLRS